MRIEERKIFICDHCRKKMFGKGAMSKHEKLCSSNPENWRACSGCVHCEPETVTYTTEVDLDEYRGPTERKSTAFRCKVLDKLMYPFKAEKKGLIKAFPNTFVNQEPMPKKCEHSKYLPEHAYGYYSE